MSKLPKAIRAFVLYDAIADFNLVSIARLVRQVGTEKALAHIKAKQAALARLAYGDDYPA